MHVRVHASSKYRYIHLPVASVGSAIDHVPILIAWSSLLSPHSLRYRCTARTGAGGSKDATGNNPPPLSSDVNPITKVDPDCSARGL